MASGAAFHLADRYEALRASRTASLEKNLLMNRGMADWMQVWERTRSDLDSASAARSEDDASTRIERTPEFSFTLSGAFQAQAVEILSGIAWAVLRS
ncbi:MAG: hypothetical protein ABIH23_16555 [bacterium]